MRSHIACIGIVTLAACAAEPVKLEADGQAIMQNQGTQLQGVQLLGSPLHGLALHGFQLAGATLGGAALDDLRLDKGELIAEQGGVTLRGTALAGAHLVGQARSSTGAITLVDYAITTIEPEDAAYDPLGAGHTYLYGLTQLVDGTYQDACGADSDGRHAAIPTTAIWDSHGNRVESSQLFTFACTTGVVAKCYRWGYRPWLTGHGDLTATHWACTRAARADYCGTGVSHTRDGTQINLWDTLSPAPVLDHGATPVGMLFEAGWSTGGAVCLSHARWLLNGPILALGCPSRLIAPGLGLLGGTVCDTVAGALGQSSSSRIFDESNLNLNLDL